MRLNGPAESRMGASLLAPPNDIMAGDWARSQPDVLDVAARDQHRPGLFHPANHPAGRYRSVPIGIMPWRGPGSFGPGC
jgi:hypothetical protein